MTEMTTALDVFIASPKRNEWIEVGPVRVYLRKAHRMVGDEMRYTFDVANVSVEEEAKGQGHFTKFLELVERKARDSGFDGVYAESVLNDRLAAWLPKMGYELLGIGGPQERDLDRNFFKSVLPKNALNEKAEEAQLKRRPPARKSNSEVMKTGHVIAMRTICE